MRHGQIKRRLMSDSPERPLATAPPSADRPIRNQSDCWGCATQTCNCRALEVAIRNSQFEAASYLHLNMDKTFYERGARDVRAECCKGIRVHTVCQMLSKMEISSRDHLFYDFGCGIGTAVFVAALVHQVASVAIDYRPDVIAVAEKSWEILQKDPVVLALLEGKQVPSIHFLQEDLTIFIPRMSKSLEEGALKSIPAILCSNMLMPQERIDPALADLSLTSPIGCSLCVLRDLWPHSRGLTHRHKEIKKRTKNGANIKDVKTSAFGVEWTHTPVDYFVYKIAPPRIQKRKREDAPEETASLKGLCQEMTQSKVSIAIRCSKAKEIDEEIVREERCCIALTQLSSPSDEEWMPSRVLSTCSSIASSRAASENREGSLCLISGTR